MKWQRADPQVRKAIADARAIGADALAEECLAIADGATEGSVKVDRLRINTRLRLAAAWAPEQYARIPATKNSAPVQVVLDFGAMGVRSLAPRQQSMTLDAHSLDEPQPIDDTPWLDHPLAVTHDEDDDV